MAATDYQAAVGLLLNGADIINARHQVYGDANALFLRVAELWSAYLGQGPIDAKDVAMMLALLKIARQKNQPLHEDNYTDAAAYMGLAFACHKNVEGAPDAPR